MSSVSLQAKVDREQLVGRRIALISVSVGIALALIKIVVGLLAHSAAVVSDGVEAIADVLSSGIVYVGLWLASKPPDEEHPYGHGRYETLAGLGVGGLLLLTGSGILWHGITAPHRTESIHSFALYALLIAAVCKLLLASAKKTVGRRIGSDALQADAWHDITDLLSTTVAFVAVSLTLLNPDRFSNADRLGGILIGGIIISLSVQVVRRTVHSLLDSMPEPSKMKEIRNVAIRVPGALGIEKCFARRTGLKYHVDLHLEVAPEMTVRDSHEIATQVRARLKDELPWVADVLVHVEPAGMVESH